MDRLLLFAVWTLTRCLQALPLTWVARIGRSGGALAWALDARHRRVALGNLQAAFPEFPPARIRDVAREHFRRIGESAACAIKTAGLPFEKLRPHLDVLGAEKLTPPPGEKPRSSRVVAIGHFGNFELYARIAHFIPAYRPATTYRGIPHALVDQFRQSLRKESGCLYFERRRDAAALKAAMTTDRLLLGLLADQHAGDHGLRLPFLGRECSTSAAPALFALRYGSPLGTAICFRVGLARWRIEIGDEIPVRHPDGHARELADIMREVNAAFEAAIRRDPANWFWVHRRWKPAPAPAAVASPPQGTPAAPDAQA